jgi:hypothetical protein
MDFDLIEMDIEAPCEFHAQSLLEPLLEPVPSAVDELLFREPQRELHPYPRRSVHIAQSGSYIPPAAVEVPMHGRGQHLQGSSCLGLPAISLLLGSPFDCSALIDAKGRARRPQYFWPASFSQLCCHVQ